MSTTRRSTPFLVAIGVLASGLTLAPAADAAPLSVVVATYNVRAAHLTAGDGGLGDGRTRMQRSLTHLEGTAVSVVALQELEKRARDVIVADPDWGIYRANANTDSIPWDGGNAVMWRSAMWSKEDGQQIKVTYTDLDGSPKTLWMPVVRLKHRATGESLTMVSIHNPGGPAA